MSSAGRCLLSLVWSMISFSRSSIRLFPRRKIAADQLCTYVTDFVEGFAGLNHGLASSIPRLSSFVLRTARTLFSLRYA